MSTDPFHRQILAALEEKRFDPQVFERCMADLLRDTFPGLVPVPGGSDAGMDGAIGDGQGEPFPLVCTTAKDVIGNLTRSLESYVGSGGRRRDVVLATSRVLTPLRRRNLRQRAREKGFTLCQIVEQRGVADRLYHSPRWYRELLGLMGTPSALSAVPASRRPMLELDLLGREADVEWLQATTGDRLLLGEPGSGKTYLIRHLVRKGWGLFLVNTDEVQLADALREQQPKVVVVDDAHRDLTQLDLLRRLREEFGQKFSIVAVSWQGDREQVADALGALPSEQIRRLELLTRTEIAEVIRQFVGSETPDLHLRQLIDQAANKPGLAATLALLYLRGDRREVLEGQALRRTLMPVFENLVGRESTSFLGALSLGGDGGMPPDAVGEFLGLKRHETRDRAIRLAAGGVLSEAGEGALAVRPPALRWALLREVFFQGSATDLDYRELLEYASVGEIVNAVHWGAMVPAGELRALVERSPWPEVWESFALLGAEEARWTLAHYSGDLVDVAEAALLSNPRAAIPKLLQRAVGAQGPLHSQLRHPLRILHDWIKELRVPPAEAMERRRLVVRQAKRYLKSGGDRAVAVHAALLALSPKREGTSSDPVDIDSLTMRWGLLPLEQLRAMESVWKDIPDLIEDIDATMWDQLHETLWEWVYPETVAGSGDVPKEFEETMRALAARVLRDLAAMAVGKPGLAAGLKGLAARIGLQLPLDSDPLFELLYPELETALERLPQREEEASAALDALAARWVAERRPKEVAEALTIYEQEAERIGGRGWPHRMDQLCASLAKATGSPELWLEAFLDQGMPWNLITPFLEETARSRRTGWERHVERCFELGPQAWAAVSVILQMLKPPAHLLDRAVDTAAHFPELVHTLCLREQIPFSNLNSLLDHADWPTALNAAAGEWYAPPRSEVRDEVLAAWRDAILKATDPQLGGLRPRAGLGFWLAEILAGDSELAFDWLRKFLRNYHSELPWPIMDDSPCAKAVEVLEEEHRLAILDNLDTGPVAGSLISRLIGRRVSLYEKFLSNDQLRRHHLTPLAGIPDAAWAEMAILALAHGYEPAEIARNSFSGPHTWWGYGQSYWGQWDTAFAALEDHPDPDLREVARHGRAMARRQIEAAEKEQRRSEL